MDTKIFNEYYSELSLSETTKTRIESICNTLCDLYVDINIKDIFLNNIINNGKTEYTSLWFFTDKYIIECKNFLYEDDFDLVNIEKKILYFNIKKSDFENLDVPTETSSVVIKANLNYGTISCNFFANGINCKQAVKLAKKYLINNLVV